MPTIPTGHMERELRKLYLRWLAGMPRHEDNLSAYINEFQAKSMALIAKEGGRVAALGALADFPAPKLLELSPYAGKVYDEMQMAAVRAGIATGLNATDMARQMVNAGMDSGFKRLNRLARTETVSAYWKNSWDSVADLPAIVMVWGAETSKRTCDYCLSRDGLVVEDSNIRDHPNGRCTPIPTLRSQVRYKGTLQPDGSVTMDPRWGAKPAVKPADTPALSSSIEGMDARSMSANQKAEAAKIMFGTSSPQYKKAMAAATKPTKATTVKSTLHKPDPKIVPPTNARVIKTTKDMDDFAKGMPVPSSLTPKAAKVLDDYAKGTAYTSNAVLRGQKTYLGRPLDPRTKAQTKTFTKEMDKMMDKSLIPEDVRVVRAVQPDAFGGIDKLKELAGGIYEDKGYMSTSLAEKVSSKVYNVKDAIEMEIVVPKGSRGIYMAGESYLKSERELLLDRGTKMAVQSVTYDERSKKWKVLATVVPGPR